MLRLVANLIFYERIIFARFTHWGRGCRALIFRRYIILFFNAPWPVDSMALNQSFPMGATCFFSLMAI